MGGGPSQPENEGQLAVEQKTKEKVGPEKGLTLSPNRQHGPRGRNTKTRGKGRFSFPGTTPKKRVKKKKKREKKPPAKLNRSRRKGQKKKKPTNEKKKTFKPHNTTPRTRKKGRWLTQKRFDGNTTEKINPERPPMGSSGKGKV